MSLANPAWVQAQLALRLLALDPALGGIAVRARCGPVRDALLAQVTGPTIRIHPNVSDETLFGGLNLSATLEKGAIVLEQGLLSRAGTCILTMAERTTPQLAARLGMALDGPGAHPLIALDEGAEVDEALPPALAERLAFQADLSEIGIGDIADLQTPTPAPHASHTDDDLTQITRIAETLGIDSLRAPLFALRAAKAHARLLGRNSVCSDDIEAACTLALAHRATRLPEPAPEEQPEQPEPEENQTRPSDMLDLPDELILDAIRALLPADLLDQIAARKARQGKGNGSGAARKGNRRGRPLPARPGKPGDGARIDIISTLRAAAPWQTIRRKATTRAGLHIRQSDIHIKRYEERSDRVLIFAVDASGSAALARLAEAKGAVELLLAQAYARRDHVSLIAFRGTEAELLLPPTRSLVQTKRRLAGLPGGGGTPLAAGLKEALTQAIAAKRKGLTPTVITLTDGRANIALDGTANRQQAAADATDMAKVLRAQGIDTMVIDTGNRPETALKTLAQTLNAAYLPLPRANAERLSAAVSTALGG